MTILLLSSIISTTKTNKDKKQERLINMTYNRSEIFKRAWAIVRADKITLSNALETSWGIAKGTIVSFVKDGVGEIVVKRQGKIKTEYDMCYHATVVSSINDTFEVTVQGQKIVATLESKKGTSILKFKKHIPLNISGKLESYNGCSVPENIVAKIKATFELLKSDLNAKIEKARREYLNGKREIKIEYRNASDYLFSNEKVPVIVPENGYIKEIAESSDFRHAFVSVSKRGSVFILKDEFKDAKTFKEILDKMPKNNTAKKENKVVKKAESVKYDSYKITESVKYDDGGKYTEYKHNFTVNGEKYVIYEYNMFDAGKVVVADKEDETSKRLRNYVLNTSCCLLGADFRI